MFEDLEVANREYEDFYLQIYNTNIVQAIRRR